jgi:hypothetical protein
MYPMPRIIAESHFAKCLPVAFECQSERDLRQSGSGTAEMSDEDAAEFLGSYGLTDSFC